MPLLIIDDLGMRKLPLTAAEELLEIIMRRYERASTLITRTDQLKTGENCLVIVPPSPPCWIDCCITDTFSNAARAAGEPRLAVREKTNDKRTQQQQRKRTAIRMPGKERPAASRSGIQRPPKTKPHHRNLGRNKKTSDSLLAGKKGEGLDHRFLWSQPISQTQTSPC